MKRVLIALMSLVFVGCANESEDFWVDSHGNVWEPFGCVMQQQAAWVVQEFSAEFRELTPAEEECVHAGYYSIKQEGEWDGSYLGYYHAPRALTILACEYWLEGGEAHPACVSETFITIRHEVAHHMLRCLGETGNYNHSHDSWGGWVPDQMMTPEPEIPETCVDTGVNCEYHAIGCQR